MSSFCYPAASFTPYTSESAVSDSTVTIMAGSITGLASPASTLSSTVPCPVYPISATFSSPILLTSTSRTVLAPSPTTSIANLGFGFWLTYTYAICSTQTANPTFTYPASCLPTNYLWGCPPGYHCTVPKANCDIDTGPPPSDYVCGTSDCALVVEDSVSDSPIVSQYITAFTYPHTTGTITDTWPVPTTALPLPTGYFNINPELFGLGWGIFTGNATSQASSSTATSIASSGKRIPFFNFRFHILTVTTSGTSQAGASSIFFTPSSSTTATTTSAVISSTHSSTAVRISMAFLGSIAITVFCVFSTVYFMKRRKRKASTIAATESSSETLGKAQLHGDDIRPSQLMGNAVSEMDGSNKPPAELMEQHGVMELGSLYGLSAELEAGFHGPELDNSLASSERGRTGELITGRYA